MIYQKSDIEKIKETLNDISKNKLSFGINLLDDFAGNIIMNDLIIISGKTGIGKSEIANTIAFNISATGKHVSYFALEAFEHEVEIRTAFRMAMKCYYDTNKKYPNINLQDILFKKQEGEFNKYFEDALSQVAVLRKNLYIKYKSKDYTIKNFEEDLLKIHLETDLIIIDHLHYFDYDDRNENSEITKIIKKLRDYCLLSGIPMIILAHMRKSPNVIFNKIPNINEIHGTSNIQKMATKVILISRDYKSDIRDTTGCSTLIRVAKNRYNGVVERYLGIMDYNSLSNSYSEDYHVAKISNAEDDYEFLQENNYPHWIKKAKGIKRC